MSRIHAKKKNGRSSIVFEIFTFKAKLPRTTLCRYIFKFYYTGCIKMIYIILDFHGQFYTNLQG